MFNLLCIYDKLESDGVQAYSLPIPRFPGSRNAFRSSQAGLTVLTVGSSWSQGRQDCTGQMGQTMKILVIRSGAVGDFIVTLPVIQILRSANPACSLALVARSRVRSLVRNVVNQFVDLDGPLLLPFFQEEVDHLCRSYRYLNGFDLVVSYLGREGPFSKNLGSLGNAQVINAEPLPPAGYAGHITEFLVEPLSNIINVASPPPPSILIGEEEAKHAKVFLEACGLAFSAPLVAVHPGSGGRRKVSPADTFCRAVNSIRTRFPEAAVLAIEGEADEEHVCAFERGMQAGCVKVKKDDLLELAAILSKARLFLGNDSGIAHLAAAVGVPTIVVFRASNPRVWAPRGREVWVASDNSLEQMALGVAEKALRSRRRGGFENQKVRNRSG